MAAVAPYAAPCGPGGPGGPCGPYAPCGPCAPGPSPYDARFSCQGPGSGFGPFGPFGFGQAPAAAPAAPDMASRLRRLFLELKPLEEKQWDAQQLVQQVQGVQVGACVKAILEQLAKPCVPLRWMQVLSVQMLQELLRQHPALVCPQVSKSDVVWLFPEHGDVDEAANFLRQLLWTKESLAQSTDAEAWKFARLLMKRTQQKDLCKVPSCPARAWLAQIWRDVPSSRPKRDLLVSCCVRWVADPYETARGKAPCLEILSEEANKRNAADAETWILSLIFQEVCRQPMQHSQDLQQLLCFLRGPPSPSAVRSLLTGLSEEGGYLMSLWACLCHWAPQAPLQLSPPAQLPTWCTTFPLHALLRGMLVAFSQLKDSKMLCRSALMSLAALGTSSSSIAPQIPNLLLLLYREGPVLPPEVWMPLVPLLDFLSQQFVEAAELATRLRALKTGSFATAPGGAGGGYGGYGGYSGYGFPGAQGAAAGAGAQGAYAQGAQGYGQSYGQAMGQVGGQVAFHTAPQLQGQASQKIGGTTFVSLPSESSKSVTLKAPCVGLQNTNNTCYMNSFVQGLFLTDAFIWRIYSFNLKLKSNPSKMDEEDFEFGKKVVELLQKQFAKMALTKHKHTDIWDILQAFPADYRSGEQQDVTETIRFVFDKLGGSDQALLKEVFAGQLQEKIQCKVCGNVKIREETFTDLVLPVPTAKEVQETGQVPTTQMLFQERLKFEEMDAENLVSCDICQKKTQAGKWSEITSPPAHLCLCLNRFTFNLEKMDFTKEKTPVKIDEGLWIGGYEYELYHTIIHTGKDASSGHYYAMGKRSEPVSSGDSGWYTMDDSQIKPAEVSLLAGSPPEKLVDDNSYVLFLRCKQAPPTPEFRVPKALLDFVKKEDKKQ